MLSWPLLLGLVIALAFIWFWQDSLGARQRANRAAQAACERMQLQFLDGTVAFARIAFGRNEQHRWRLRRTYVFDYTATSIERRQGFVVMLGARVESVGFAQAEAEAEAESESAGRVDARQPADPHGSNVLDLSEWRQRRQHKPPDRNSSGDHGW